MRVGELIEILKQYDPDREVLTLDCDYDERTLDSDPFEVMRLTDTMSFFLDSARGDYGEHKDAVFIVSATTRALFEDWFKEWSKEFEIDYKKDEAIKRPTT